MATDTIEEDLTRLGVPLRSGKVWIESMGQRRTLAAGGDWWMPPEMMSRELTWRRLARRAGGGVTVTSGGVTSGGMTWVEWNICFHIVAHMAQA